MRSKVNIREPLINVVTENKPKVLGCSWAAEPPTRDHRLGPKGKGSGIGAPNSPIADAAPPAERRDLTYAGTGTERGKPVGLPVDASTRESEPQGAPKGLRVWEGGGSECLSVMAGIGVELTSDITPRESGQTFTWSLVTRKFGEPLSRGKANDGGLRPSWCAL